MRLGYRLLCFAIVLAWCVTGVSAAEKPNILFVLTDDQGWWDLGLRGNKDIDTPVMDQLAAEGVDFGRFYAEPVCAPTRAGLMTGRYYLRTGIYNTRFGGDSMGLGETTIAEQLRQAGYRTACFGKWHLGKYAPYQPHRRGFDEFLGFYNGHIDEYDYPDQIVHNGTPVEGRRYATELFTDAAIDFIEASGDRPWFCYLAYNAPHSPHVVGTSHDGQPRGDRYITKYLERGLTLRNARIYAMIDILDQNLGRLLDKLDEHHLTENTVVVFMTDNGGVSSHFKAGLKAAKGSIFEGGVRVPLLVRWPGHFPAGKSVQAQCSHVDLFPTFCELAGAPLPDDRAIDGKSLLPLLKAGEGTDHHQYVYHLWDRYFPNPNNRWAISDQRWKLACQVSTGQQATPRNWRLFDLAADPSEQRNLVAEHPEVVRRLRAEFVRWFEEVTAGQEYHPVPIPVGHPDEPLVDIQASWASWHGENTEYVFRGYDWDTIEGWQAPTDYATWNLDVVHAGRYELLVSYARSSHSRGKLRIGVGEQGRECNPPPTPTPDVFERMSLGTIQLDTGPARLKAQVIEASSSEVLRLNRIFLRRVDDNEKP